MKNLFIASTAAVVAVGSVIMPVSATEKKFFTDVNESQVLYPEIADLFAQGKIEGFTDGTFRQHEVVTRGQAAKMIAAILELNTTTPSAPNLKDVSKDKWYYGSIAALVEHKIMGGFKDGTFRPDQTLTRAEASRLISEAFKLTTDGPDVLFRDVHKDDWYYTYVKTLVTNKVTFGKAVATFAPGDAVTRGELVAFASRAKKASEENVTPPPIDSGGGSTGGTVTPPPPPGPGGGGTGGTDETANEFDVSIIEDKNKFGYVTLNLKNQGGGKVWYQHRPYFDDAEFPKVGDSVPTGSKEYTGEAFINWQDERLYVYLVDSANKILDIVYLYPYYGQEDPFHIEFHDDGTATASLLFEMDDRSVEEYMDYVYVYQNNVKRKVTDFSGALWNESTELPSFTFNIDGIDKDKPGIIFFGSGNLRSSRDYKGGFEQESIVIQALFDLVQDSDEWPKVLDTIAYEEINVTGDDGEPYTYQNTLVERDSLSLKTYRQRLLEDAADLQTAVSLKTMVLDVNAQLKEKVDVLKTADRKINSMFKEVFDTLYEERYRDDLTWEDLEEVRSAVNAVSDEFSEKIRMISDVDDAERFLNIYVIDEYMKTVNLYVPAGLDAGNDITSVLSPDGKPEALRMVPYRTGQKFVEGTVSITSSYLKVENEKLVLIRPNQTGEDITEFIELELFNGNSRMETVILPIVIHTSERDEEALSDNIELMINYDDERVINTIDALNKSIVAYRGTTVEQLKQGLTASDYSAQSYRVEDAAGDVKTSGDIESGDILTVTAENGQQSDKYTLQTLIFMKDITEQGLGSFTFNAVKTTVEELQGILSISPEGTTEQRNIAINKVEGSSNAYVASFENAVKDQKYTFVNKAEEQLTIEYPPYLVWRSFTLSNYNIFPGNNAVLLDPGTIDIESADKINITFDTPGAANSITLDGVTITPTIAAEPDGNYKITFSSTGTDEGKSNFSRFISVDVEIDEIVNDQISLLVRDNGTYMVNVRD